jgi:type IV secretion system protein VirB8
VRAREGWLAASAEADFRQVALLSSPPEQRRFAEARRPGHPGDPATAFGEDAMVGVEVRAISFINARVASVRFRRTIWRLQGVSTDDWVAVVSFTYTKAPMRESDRLLNPLGFQVNAYRIDPEVA